MAKKRLRATGDKRLSKAPRPDPIDIALLAALRDEGRATVRDLATRIHLGSATTSVRLQALRKSGLVKGIHARVDYGALGFSLCTYILLQLNDITGRGGKLTDQLLAFPEVEEVAWVTGDVDVLVKAWSKDTKHLEGLVVRIDELGARSRTMLVLGEPHVKPGVAFEAPATALE